MPICKVPSCQQFFSSFLKIEGRKHNLSKRKYCLTCSPFGVHNTKKKDDSYDHRKDRKLREELCLECKKPNTSAKGNYCNTCNIKKRISSRANVVYGALGTACWLCKYDKGDAARSILEFHHVDPKTKKLSLSTRELVGYTWEQVREELQKCVMLCCRCHREHHAGIVSMESIQDIYTTKWPLVIDKLPLTVKKYKNE